MSGSSLRQHVRAYYAGKGVPDRKRDSLLALLTSKPPSAARRGRLRSPWTWRAAAAVLVAAAAGYLVVVTMPERTERRRLPSAFDVAREVAANHARGLEPEFRSANYAVLRREMSKLDFSVIEPTSLTQDGLRLVGARYCSVQCAVAAQIRLEDPDSESHTLYEVADDGLFAHIEATEVSVGGVRVRIWREEGLLLCLASPGR